MNRIIQQNYRILINKLSLSKQIIKTQLAINSTTTSDIDMKKTKQFFGNNGQQQCAVRQSENGQRQKYKQTEKTIQQLKQSIGSIEKMIEKSQQILRNTKPLNPRQVRSDSLELKLRFDSREKSSKKYHHNLTSQLDQMSATAITRNNTNANTTIQTQHNYQSKNSQSKTKIPQKTKPIRPYLFIDTENFNASDGDKHSKHSGRSKIFINQSVSPISAATRQREAFEQSFADSLESPFAYGRRLRTEAINDSYESLERFSSIERKSDSKTIRQDEIPVKRIVLKRRKYNNQNHMRTISELQREVGKPRKYCIFEPEKNPEKIKRGKYSYCRPNPQICINRNQIKERLIKQKQQERMSPYKLTSGLEPSKQPCLKFNKQNQNSQLQQFYRKVKQFGFVQRYLSFSEIGCIYEYLKKSSIPQHKWPLYVVDKVYDKMQGLSRVKL